MDKQPYIVGVGAANADLNGASLAPIHLRDSNPGHISLSAGGVTRNVCEPRPAGRGCQAFELRG